MSRIHEALKKAEQERATVQTVGAADILTASPIENPPAARTIRACHGSDTSTGCRQGGGNDGRLPSVRRLAETLRASCVASRSKCERLHQP